LYPPLPLKVVVAVTNSMNRELKLGERKGVPYLAFC